MAKRLLSLLLSAALALGLLSACAQEGDAPTPSETEPSPTQSEPSPNPSEEPTPSADPAKDLSAQNIVNTVYFSMFQATDGVEEVQEWGHDDFYLTDILGIDKKDCQSFGLLRSYDNSTWLAVLRCSDEDAADRVEGILRGGADKAMKQENPTAVYRQGLYLGLFQCLNPDLAADAFLSILSTGQRLDRTAPVAGAPAFALKDLLFRLLTEGGACPDWKSLNQNAKGWTDGGSDPFTVAAAYGAVPGQYEACYYAFWDLESHSDWRNFTSYPCQLALFQTGGEEEAKALVLSLERGLEARKRKLRENIDYMNAGEFAPDSFYALNPSNLKEDMELQPRCLEMLEHACAAQGGRYAAVFICEDPARAAIFLPRFAASADTEGYFLRYVNSGVRTVEDPDPNYPDRELFTPPNEEDMSLYDTAPILSAWEKGDPAGLSDYDRETYDAAQAVLEEIITDGMTDLEKETAVYTWLADKVAYDWRHQDIMAETPRSSYEPYGGLVDRMAVCLGYATSFQLLMDMTGIECVTVVGAAFRSSGDHAWNVVKLGGKWYCVDATWDANGRQQLGEAYEWRYFNVTSDEMAKDHQWDYVNVPEAVTEGNGKA